MFELFNEIFENFDSLQNSLSVLLKYKFCFYAICYIILFIAHFDSVIKKLNTNSFLDHKSRILKMSFKILPLLYCIIQPFQIYLYLSSPFSSHLLSPSTLPLHHPPPSLHIWNSSQTIFTSLCTPLSSSTPYVTPFSLQRSQSLIGLVINYQPTKSIRQFLLQIFIIHR